MDRRDLEEIERFLSSVGRPTLFAYYGLEADVSALDAEDTVKKRRAWAQGQQSNPKYKSEALFLIKNNTLLRRVLVEQLDEYREHVRDDTANRNLDVLTLFIKGTITSGSLSSQAEAAILHQGRQLELSDAAVVRRIEELLQETGVVRDGLEPDDVTAEATSIDHYAILGVAPTAPPASIEEAYRNRYRWARNLKDLKRSAEILQALDDAWRILSDPKRRVRYDERRVEMLEVTDEVEKRAALLMGLLGGPEGAPPGELQPRREPPAPPVDPSVHEVGFVPVRPVSVERVAPAPADITGAGRAPAPPSVTGRTIGLAPGPQSVATLGPRLGVDEPDSQTLAVRGRPVRRTVVVRNVGHGKMPGKVASDREWLKVQPARLDPAATEQRLTIDIDATQLPWGNSVGTINIVTDHGERRSLAYTVNRRSWLPLAALAVVGMLFGALLLVGILLFRPGPAVATARLALTVDPVADRILVDGKQVGTGSFLEIAEPASGKPFTLRVEADGFATQEEAVALNPGEQATRLVKLELTDAMTWHPPEGDAVITLGPAGEAELDGARGPLRACFAGVEGIGEAVAIYRASITADGQVRRVDVTVPNFPVEPALPCIQRVFRGLRLPTFASGHAIVETRLAVPVKK
jgi:hypothetical protein